MSKSKIEPMSVEQMRAFLACVQWDDDKIDDVARVILAWIHAEARARMAEHLCQCTEFADWIAAVKKEVGWLED